MSRRTLRSVLLVIPLFPSSLTAFQGVANTANFRLSSTTTHNTYRSYNNDGNNKYTSLGMVSIGLGPMEKDQKQSNEQQPTFVPVAGIDYEIPNHDEYRTSRRSKLDEQCDLWYEKLLYNNNNNNDAITNNIPTGILTGPITDAVINKLLTPVPLVNDIEKDFTNIEWTPYVTTKLPWTPLTPAYGLEQFGLPTPRRNSEQWRHFDIPGLITNDYSGSIVTDNTNNVDSATTIRSQLVQAGSWVDDTACDSRLVYINGKFNTELSKCSSIGCNMNSAHLDNDIVTKYLSRLTDGYTDELVHPVDIGADDDKMVTSFEKLSSPNHNVGPATSQFAINTQLGTACFAALNTIKCQDVAYVHMKRDSATTTTTESANDNESKPAVFIINVITKHLDLQGGDATGGSIHPRVLVIAEPNTKLNIIQNSINLDSTTNNIIEHTPKLMNGYTQVFVEENANVTHSYLNQYGGEYYDTADDGDETDNKNRPELKDTSFDTVDVHVNGGYYDATDIIMATTGRIKLAHSVTLLKEESACRLNGLSIAGTGSRTDIKTTIHHIANGCTSQQIQKNLVGGIGTTSSFRGRIRVEQSAQQTDSQQLSRTVLLGDKQLRAWTVPSLEIIADDVKCTHGATVSDLSEEELFYLRSRGIDPISARNVLMYAFCDDIVSHALESVATTSNDDGVTTLSYLRQRISERLRQLVPKGPRAIQGEFQSI